MDDSAPPTAPVFALFSGGHDSLCATALAARMDGFAGVLHINTGIGIEETREFVWRTCRAQGWPLTELRSDARYEDLVLERGGFPYGPKAHSSMYWYLKKKPLRVWLRGQVGPVRLITGIRRSESVRRMGAAMSVPEKRDGRITWVNPILDWTANDCTRFIAGEGLPRNQVVDVLHRSGECLCGALAQEREIHELAYWYPEAAERIQALEVACEDAGLAACVWAGKTARAIHDDQGQLFRKSQFAPLCSSCTAV